ncbi:MAG: hypothetical protein OEY14_07030 [Myxococcales bacterium]|nr:hypothetical protein [Myxococcales bacterium]
MRALLCLSCVLLLASESGSADPPQPARSSESLPAIRFAAPEPSGISLNLSYPDRQSLWGEGELQLYADPGANEIRVSLLLGSAMAAPRLKGCTLQLGLDGQWESFESRYAGMPLSRGAYDAVLVEMDILHLRRIADASQIRLQICEMSTTLEASARPRIREFVERFEALGNFDGPPPPAPPLDGPVAPALIDELPGLPGVAARLDPGPLGLRV